MLIKNIVKKAYGQHSFTHYEEQKKKEAESIEGDESDPAFYIDANALQCLQANLVNLAIGSTEKLIQAQLLECISLMSKRNVQKEWQNLIPELI